MQWVTLLGLLVVVEARYVLFGSLPHYIDGNYPPPELTKRSEMVRSTFHQNPFYPMMGYPVGGMNGVRGKRPGRMPNLAFLKGEDIDELMAQFGMNSDTSSLLRDPFSSYNMPY